MAQFPKVNGDFQPVAVFDDGVGNNAAGTSHAGFNNGLRTFKWLRSSATRPTSKFLHSNSNWRTKWRTDQCSS